MKKKKLWIILLSVVLGLGVVFAGLYFTTKLSSVSIEFRTRLAEGETRLSEGVLDSVKDSAEFNYKDSVLFLNTEKYADKIEKSNPYIKVEQMLRKFPNKLCVYVSERVPKFRVLESENSDTWLILDDEFKVLEKVTNEFLASSEDNLEEKTVEIKYFYAKLSAGEFLDKETDKTRLNAILSGVYGRTKDYFVADSIDYSSDDNTFKITMRSVVEGSDNTITYEGGCVIHIENIGNLAQKALNATSVYAGDGGQIDSINKSQKVVIISGDDGCIVKNQE